jgi:hypothetical protein
MPLPNQSFGSLYARKCGCDEAAVVDRLFRESTPPWKRPLAVALQRVSGSVFEPDRDVIRDAIEAEDYGAVLRAVEGLRGHRARAGRFWRETLGIRVSGRRLLRIAAGAFGRTSL